ncbi:N-acylethanolamine-hydrolyzing acid amidase-like [Acanthaster planci]|uniref:N-acylethanolamine-hydrolyzing acid amidase n=1 Tax=Acanthaster planci TaxID=133434 RepID=A0A8B7YNG2_ACAPL|nr:N-acylethanolamine-hydrolyzing acid amidase-like [Acanthaster planci]
MWRNSSWFILAALLVIGGPTLSRGLPKAPRYSLNLDLAEEERWNAILRHWDVGDYQRKFKEIMHKFMTAEVLDLLDIIAGAVDDYLPVPYAGEIRGIAKYLQMDIGEVVLLNTLYDLTVSGGCTSIVAEDTKGNIWHARNMDYDFTATLRNWTVVVDFQSKGKTLYTSTTFLGQAGVFTGQRPNAFTVSLNERDKGSMLENVIQFLKALISNKTAFTSFQIRDALSRNDTMTYDSALKHLAYHPETAPNYFIIGGNKATEGAVITRDRLTAADVWCLDLSKGRWFVLETNYDHWEPPPKSDDRRDPGNKAMNAIGQDAIDLDGMLKVLSIRLVCNSGTVYTTLMSAAHPSSYVTFIRHCE